MFKTRGFSFYGPGIELVEVDRFNDLSVWINGRRSARSSSYEFYHATFEEAKEYLIKKYSQQFKSLSEQLMKCEENLNKVKNLCKPQ